MSTSRTGDQPTKGRQGNTSYYERYGQVIARTAHNNRTRKGNTEDSLAWRTRMANLINNWRQLKPVLPDCFEDRKPTASEYNAFIANNIGASRVCLTKREAEMSTSVAEGFTVSHGTLPQPVQISQEEGLLLSDIKIDPLPKGMDTPMLAFGVALQSANPGRLDWGDRIRFVRLQQRQDINTHRPFVAAYLFELTLSQADTRTLAQALAGIPFTEGFSFERGRLAAPAHPDSLCAWIILRPQKKGRPRVTTQQLVGSNPLLERYTSPAQLQAAIDSYGQD